MRLILLLFFFCASFIFADEKQPLVNHSSIFKFEPPKGWKAEKKLPEGFLGIYLGKAKTRFTPTINIASEKTKLDLETYIKKTIQIHSKETGTSCREVGTVTTQAGKAQLLQIESDVNFGKIQFLQAILLKDQVAYVITATALKDEFPIYTIQFYQSFKTFSLE